MRASGKDDAIVLDYTCQNSVLNKPLNLSMTMN